MATPRTVSSLFTATKLTNWKKAANSSWAVVALALALETAILTYLLVEFGEENGGGLEIPDSVNLAELIEAANEIDVLNEPIDIPSLIREDDTPPKYVAKVVVDKVRLFRNLIHPARALRKKYDPRTFSHQDLERFKKMYESLLIALCIVFRAATC